MAKRITGTIERHAKGYGFLIPDDGDMEDVFIPPGQLNGSMTGDRVEIKTRSSDRGQKDVGQVLTILERAVSHIIGILKISGKKSVVTPTSVDLDTPVEVPDQSDSSRSADGKVVEVEIENYQPLRGIIVDVLGDPGDPQVEEKVILKKYDLDREFPDPVLQAAHNLPDRVSPGEIKGRRDLRSLPVITIDPHDAKDLDDAVSVQRTSSGEYRVGVHITDVSHYVPEGGPLDQEARRRATSAYLADEVIPMFPKSFSNGIGSLNQVEDRLALSVFLTVEPDGRVVDSDFARSVIHVDNRLSYDEVDEYLEGESTPDSIRPQTDLVDVIVKVSQRMRRRRMDRGSLDFDLPEVSLRVSEGEVQEIVPVEHTVSHQAIEEFMIAANEAVAGYLTEKNAPLLYRVHEPPAADDVKEFASFLEGMGYDMSLKGLDQGGISPKEFQRALGNATNRTEERIISWNMLRSMKQARYSPENLKHFGLASPCYCHFTSPIRRYPDLTVHRVLKTVLERGTYPGSEASSLRKKLPKLARHTSERERNATDAERESIKVKLLEYMEDRVGEEREGYITSVVKFGCFVQLKNTVEGLIHVSNLKDYYIFNEDDYTLTGESSGRVLHIGDRVKVQIARVDVPKRELDFELIEILESHLGDDDG